MGRLTAISGVTGALAALVNLAVLFGLDLSVDQIAGINTAIVAVGAVIHSLVNPAIPVGLKE